MRRAQSFTRDGNRISLLVFVSLISAQRSHLARLDRLDRLGADPIPLAAGCSSDRVVERVINRSLAKRPTPNVAVRFARSERAIFSRLQRAETAHIVNK